MKDVIWNGEGKKIVGYFKLNLCIAQGEHEWPLVLRYYITIDIHAFYYVCLPVFASYYPVCATKMIQQQIYYSANHSEPLCNKDNNYNNICYILLHVLWMMYQFYSSTIFHTILTSSTTFFTSSLSFPGYENSRPLRANIVLWVCSSSCSLSAMALNSASYNRSYKVFN